MAYNTAVRGLTAQGNTSLKGMCYSNNDVAFTMSSSEFANTGFKYIVEITDGITSQSYKFYIAPNAVGSGVFNAKTIFNQLVPTNVTLTNTDDVLLQINEPKLVDDNLVNNFTVDLYEGYDVAGVFTEDTSVTVKYSLMCVYGKGKSNFLVMGSNETLPIALSQYYDNTLGFNKETVATRINIPAALQSEVINWQRVSRSNVLGAQDSAYKILSWIADDGTYINDNYQYRQNTGFRFEFYDEDSSLITTFDIPFLNGAGAIYYLPVGLKNLVEGSYITQDDADSTIFWTVFAYGGPVNAQWSAKYGFYIDDDCKYNPVHIYWLNQLGGWDSYSFIKKNERSIDVEKKRYKTYLGNYNTADVGNPFDTKNYSRSINEREPITKTFINLTSDWLTESEFKAMKDLFYSKSVWMVDDNVDGFSILPVVVEDTNYLMKRERNSRKYNQTLRLQLANEYDTINITASEYPIPGPDPCDYYSTFSYISGSAPSITLGTNLGDACNLVLTNATGGRYCTIGVGVSGDTPIQGQTYYVQIDYTTAMPSQPPLKRFGWIRLGNILTGGTTTYFDMMTPGTPIIATGVWGGNSGNIGYFDFRLPAGWLGSISGNVYITIGFGNCP